MLSEGWDAKTVTHIMGLRAFTSQLLCEQVVGRGLRRTSYEVNPETGLFEAEYVNIFGAPFTFLPHESEEGVIPDPPQPKTAIEPVSDKAPFEISWPNVIRIDHVYRPRLSLDWQKVKMLELNASQTAQIAELAPIVEGKPDVTKIAAIDLEHLAREFRTQPDAKGLAGQQGVSVGPTGPPSRAVHPLGQDQHHPAPVLSGRAETPSHHHAQHDQSGAAHLGGDPLRQYAEAGADLRPGPPDPFNRRHGYLVHRQACEYTTRSHINFCVYDSTWEASEAFELDHNPAVEAWVKNDHLGFEVFYVHRGVVRKYRPDFIIGLKSGGYLVLETKGQDSEQDQTKRRFLDEWVNAVNGHSGFGHWSWMCPEIRRYQGYPRPSRTS